MKKSILIIACLLMIGTLMFFGCSKENKFDSYLEKQSNNEIINNPKTGDPPHHLVVDFPNQGDIFCCPPAINCFLEVVIKPKQTKDITDYEVYQTLQNYLANNNISGFFTNAEWIKIFPNLTTDLAQQIIKHKVSFIKKFDTQKLNTEIYLILEEGASVDNFTSEEVIMAMPITILKD